MKLQSFTPAFPAPAFQGNPGLGAQKLDDDPFASLLDGSATQQNKPFDPFSSGLPP